VDGRTYATELGLAVDDLLEEGRHQEVRVHQGRTLPSGDVAQLVGEENDVEYRLEDRRVQVGDLLREHQDVVGHSLVAASPSV